MAEAKAKSTAPSFWTIIIVFALVALVIVIAASAGPQGGNQVNLEYFFRLLYDLLFGAKGSVSYTGLASWLAHLWLYIIILGYILAAGALFAIVYITVKLFELREREEHHYNTLVVAPETANGVNPRWAHIQSLIGGASTSEWREAIIEADILLDDVLTRQGYTGEGVGEKLKQVEQADFHALQDAWEAHKVRNQIAHAGSSFDLSQTVAQRTIARYENVFREFHAI